MSAPVAPLGPVDASDRLFNAVALLATLDCRLMQLADHGEINNDRACELARVVRVCSELVQPVASVVVDWELSTGGAA